MVCFQGDFAERAMSVAKLHHSKERGSVKPTLRVPVQPQGLGDSPSGNPMSKALRKEAEQRWADADRTAAQRERKVQRKSRARSKRRETVSAHKKEIARLSGELARAKRRLKEQTGK